MHVCRQVVCGLVYVGYVSCGVCVMGILPVSGNVCGMSILYRCVCLSSTGEGV